MYSTVLPQMDSRVTCGGCGLQSSVEYEYFKERFSVSCAAAFSKVSTLAAGDWLLALPQCGDLCLLSLRHLAAAMLTTRSLWQDVLFTAQAEQLWTPATGSCASCCTCVLHKESYLLCNGSGCSHSTGSRARTHTCRILRDAW